MSAVALVASVLLGAAFVLAGGSKLAAGAAWPAQARDLGAPRFAAPLLPWLELAVGAALVVQLVEPWPALAAIALLLAFSALIALRLSQGRRPPCACFGAWSASPIGPGHLARNGALLALGVLSLWG
ncbi:MAG: MauE/DoxX family redox-associated membrane protein [Ilumatobacter sp.]|uniref:MauE/DoxX family redox-associated membrane protein n=1 Tax=Ilumatobacter sp. TaxID=1967498 RepID=UPI0026356CE7|nr:MauE/DoxX family redox-associated membrane protein [Ilumatobacter sp.]MDJ0771521.1 MauE/DoxX family redox-associated membrane protein [Ilumatobacter sp.]